MSRSIFGWSYPPGCSGPPDESEGPCDVCGNSVENCLCHECPKCGSVGDPRCYQDHGLVRTQGQRVCRQEATIAQLRELLAQAEDIGQKEMLVEQIATEIATMNDIRKGWKYDDLPH
jgi:hypothetical protein